MSKEITDERLVLTVGPVPETFTDLDKEGFREKGFRVQAIEEAGALPDALDGQDDALIVVSEKSERGNASEVLRVLQEAGRSNPVMILEKDAGSENYLDTPYRGIVHTYDADEDPAILLQGVIRAIIRNAVRDAN